MPWPRPRRALCFLCVASCESVASSFGVQSLFAAAKGTTTRSRGSLAVNMVRGGGSSHGGRGTDSGRLGMASGGVQDSAGGEGGGGGGGGRQGVPVVRAASQAQQVTTVPDTASDPGEQDQSEKEPTYKPSRPPPLSPTEEGVKIELGKYKATPFEEGSFPPQFLYAVQLLRSEEDESFGAAFISLRAANDRAPTRTWNVGRPNATSMVSLARFKLWWMMPKHSIKANEVPPETQTMLTKLPPDPETGRQLYGLFIPLIDGQAKCSLKGLPDRSLQLFAETGCPDTPVPSSDVAGLYVGVDEDPFKLLEKSFKLVNARLRNQVKAGSFGAGGLVPGLVLDAEKQLSRWKKSEVISKKVDKTSPDFSNYLGWCTWDSFYTSVDHDKVFTGLTSLRNSGIKPKWLVLDDGWQSTTNIDANNGEQWMDHLTSIKANDKFRNKKEGTDLSRTVKKAREEFGVNYFLTWHAIAGYWAGLDLDSPDLAKYKPRRAVLNAPPGIIEVDPDMKMFFRVSKFLNKRFGVVPPDRVRAFYDDYHRYLRAQGVDGVKVDAQSVVNFLGPKNGGSVMLTRAFHSALSKSVRKHFSDSAGAKGEGGRIIHCMCHDSEILLQLPACYDRQPVIRGSDDFYPRDKSSHGPHIYANAFNGLMISNCGLQDWDMFQTNLGEASWMHAAARAISGGPVYISDRPGDHNTNILRRMVLEDGGVLKPPANALPCLNSLFVDAQRDEDALLSIWNECDAPGHGVVAVFNLYGSAWSQRRRSYSPVRTSTGALSGVPLKGESGETEESGDSKAPPASSSKGVVEGGVRPSDCHRLLRDHVSAAEAAKGGSGGTGGAVEEKEEEESRYAIHFHFDDRLLVGGLHDEQPLSLGRGRSEVAAISKVSTIRAHDGDEGEWASIGLADMFNAGGAIASEAVSQTEEGAEAQLTVKGCGRFLALCSLRPAAVLFDGNTLEFSHGENGEGVPYIEVDLPEGYTGAPRQLVVRWDKGSRAAAAAAA